MSRTGIAELGVGLTSAYMFFWMFPSAYTLQMIVNADPASSSALKLNAALCILVIGLYGLIGAYGLFAFFERVVLGAVDLAIDYYREFHEGWL